MEILRLPATLRRDVISKTTFTLALRKHLATQPLPSKDTSLPPLEVNAESRKFSPGLLTLSSSTLNSYTIGIPPNAPQLKYAASLFHAQPPEFLFSAANFRSFPPSNFPEVAFLGRSNVGKSSLLNALFGRTRIKDAHVSKRPGRTKTMNGFGVAGWLPFGAAPKSGEKEVAWKRFPRGGLVVVDMPGYGSGSREEWGKEIMKYLENRKQLRRTFVMVDTEHGLKSTDIAILTHLRRNGISHQIVLSKVDKLLYPNSRAPQPQKLHNKLLQLQDLCSSIRHRLNTEIEDGRKSTGDILCCSAEKSLDEKHHNQRLGVDEIRWAVLSACGMECDDFGQTKPAKLHDIHMIEEDD